MKARLYFAAAVVALAYAAGWLIGGEASPLREYFLWNVSVKNWWMATNVVPIIIAAVVEGNPHSGNEAIFLLAFTAQWFAFGYAVASLASKLRSWFWKPL